MRFSIIRRTAGREGLKLARVLEKDTYKPEAHHRHLKFTHYALENGWFPKSLRFNPPGNAKVIDKGNHRNLKALESWHTALTDEADNNSNTLPAQYTILLRKELKKH